MTIDMEKSGVNLLIPDGVCAGTLLPARSLRSFESWAGIEPAHGGFANLSVSTSPPGRTGITLAFWAVLTKSFML